MLVLDMLSIAVEMAVVLLGLLIAVKKKKGYGWCFTLTFALYVFYDLSRFLSFSLDPIVASLIFLVASLSILCAVWRIYKG